MNGPSGPTSTRARGRLGLAFLAAAVLPAAALAASGRALSPADGEIVPSQPRLVFEYGEFGPKMRFSIELSRDKFRDEIVHWDMRRSMRGWALYVAEGEEEASGGIFTPPRELPEGTWYWRANVHDGGADIPLGFVSSFRVDATPPGEVDGLEVTFDKEKGWARLSWDPVFLDLAGEPETVSHYRVYRYDRLGLFVLGNLKLAGTTESPSFVDRLATKLPGLVFYYRVTAVDSVGNETVPGGTRDRTASAEPLPVREGPGRKEPGEQRRRGRRDAPRPAPGAPPSD